MAPPTVISRPHSDLALGELCSPRYAPAYQGAFSLWWRKGKAFRERAFALHRQQHGKQNIEFAPPGIVSADARGSDLKFFKFHKFLACFGCFLPANTTNKNIWITEILINHFFATFKVSRPETFETETRKNGSRDESRDSCRDLDQVSRLHHWYCNPSKYRWKRLRHIII